MAEKYEIILSAIDQTKDAFSAVEKHVDSLKGVASGLDGIAGRLPVVGTALAGALGTASLTAFITHSIDVEAKLHDLAIASGASAESLSAMQLAAKLADTSIDDVAATARKLGQSLGEAKLKGGDKAKLFESLGIDPRSVNDSGEALFELAKKLDAMPDKFKAMEVAKELLGKNVSLPFLNELAQQEALIAKVTSEQAAAADQFNDNMVKLRAGAGQVGIALANSVLPAMNGVLNFSLEVKKEWGTIAGIMVGIGGGSIAKALGVELDPLKRAANETAEALREVKRARDALDNANRAAREDSFIPGMNDFRQALVGNRESALAQAQARKRAALAEQARLEKEKTESDYRDYLRRKAGKDMPDGALGGGREADPYAQVVRQIDERTAAMVAEGQATNKLSDTQRFALKVLVDLRDGYLKLDTAQKQALSGKLETLLAADKANADMEQATKLQKEYAEAVEKMIGPLERQAQQLEAANVNFGKTEAEIQRTIIASLEEARAVAAANGAWEEHLDVLDKDIEARKRIAAASEQGDINKMLGDTETAKIEKARKDMLLLTDALDRGQISEEQYIEAVVARLNLVADKTKEVDSFARDMGLTFASAFEDAIVEGKSFSDVLKGIEKDILRIVVRKAITEPVGEAVAGAVKGWGIGDSIGSIFKDLFGGFRAGGGGVDAGKFYVVGEKGPELLYAGASGTVVPNGAMAANSGGFSLENLRVELVNQGSSQQRVTGVQPKLDAEGLVVQVFLNDWRNNGPMRQTMAGGSIGRAAA